MSDEKQGPSQRPDAEPREPPLSLRRPLFQEDDYYDRPLCPCEETDAENQSEYDVAGEWVNYDGPINEDIFVGASSNAALDIDAQMRAYYQEPLAPPSAFASVPNGYASDADTYGDDDGGGVDDFGNEGVIDRWSGMMTEISAVQLSTADTPSEAAEKVDAILDPQAAEREKQEPGHFASTGDQAVTNLADNLERSQSSGDGVATAVSAGAQALQANDGGDGVATAVSAGAQALQANYGGDGVATAVSAGAQALQANYGGDGVATAVSAGAQALQANYGGDGVATAVSAGAQALQANYGGDGVATAVSAGAQALQANDGGVAQAEITSAESQAVREASGTNEVVNE